MVLGGMWHGANWTFILWGCWHGGLLAGERARGFRNKERQGELPKTVPRVAWTMLLVMIGWVVFRATDVSSAVGMYAGMVGLNGLPLSDALVWQVNGQHLLTVAIGVAFVILSPRWWRPEAIEKRDSWFRFAASGWVVMPLFLLAVLRLAAQAYSPFLYFQF
jgi:alginate O-acetyltransferase complex protein AlgI